MSLAIIAHLESTGHTLEQKIEKNEAVIKMCLVPLHSLSRIIPKLNCAFCWFSNFFAAAARHLVNFDKQKRTKRKPQKVKLTLGLRQVF